MVDGITVPLNGRHQVFTSDIAVQLGRKPAPVAKTSESVTAPAEPQQDNPNPPHASAPSVLIVPSLIEKGQESGIDPFTAHQVGQ